MPIDSPQAIKFSNEKLRVLATLKVQVYQLESQIVDEWNAQSLSTVITNTSDVVVDGAATDGRSIITGADATNIVTRAMEDIADLEAGNNAKLNTLMAVAVLGT